MQDRVPTPGQEGRVLITPEDGSTPFYAKVSMADNPTNPGTPLNKQNLLQDMIAALYAENNQAVPNDLFSDLAPLVQHWWRKEVANGYVEKLTRGSGYFYVANYEVGRTIQYARSINIDQMTGAISLQSPTSVTITRENSSQVYNSLLGNYVLGANSDPTNIHKIDLNATGGTDYSSQGVYLWFYGTGTYTVSSTAETSVATMVVSPNRNQYPDSGEQDGATYIYKGNFVLDGPGARIEAGSYIGTGTYGSGNPNTLTFSNEPEIVFISPAGTANWAIFIIKDLTENYKGHGYISPDRMSYNYAKYSGRKLDWYNNYSSNANMYQMNFNGAQYHYVAIGLAGGDSE